MGILQKIISLLRIKAQNADENSKSGIQSTPTAFFLENKDAYSIDLKFSCKHCGSPHYKIYDKETLLCEHCKSVYTLNDRKFKAFSMPQAYSDITKIIVPYKEGNRWGMMNVLTQSIIIPTEYDQVTYFREDKKKKKVYYMLVRKGEKWGAINIENEVIIPFEYDAINQSSTGYWIMTTDKKQGVVNPEGNQILPFDYDSLSVMTKLPYNNTDSIYIILRKQSSNGNIMAGLADGYGRIIVPVSPQIKDIYGHNSTTGLWEVYGQQQDLIGYIYPDGTLKLFN